MRSIFEYKTNSDLLDYLNIYNKYRNIDIHKCYNMTLRLIKHYHKPKDIRNDIKEYEELQLKWYNSLKENIPDYSIYDNELYLSELWACWIIYSRKYLLSINSDKSLATKDDHGNWYNMKSIIQMIGKINTIADLGCGFGYITAGLKELFLNTNIYGTNIKDSIQYNIASEIGQKYNFKIVNNIQELPKIDLIFASEYFEHIISPIDHLSEIIKYCNPRYFLFANTFTGKATGHFNQYYVFNKIINNNKISYLFGKYLRLNKYKKIETKLWNNRPSFWIKNN